MIYLLISICISSCLFIIFKLFVTFKIDTLEAIVVNYLVAAVLGFYLSDVSISFEQIVIQPWFFGAFLMGMMFVAVFNIMALTSQRNGITVASVVSKMSVVITILFGVWYYGERLGCVKFLGVVMALAAIYFTSVREKVKQAKNKATLLVPILLFFGSGFIDIGLKYLETRFVQEDGVSLFSAVIFGWAFGSGLFILITQRVLKRTVPEFKNILAGIALGIPNYFSIVYLLKALGVKGLESSSVFTLNNVGIVVVSTLFGLLLFHEKLMTKNWLGIVMAIVSMLMVMLADE